MGVRGIDELLAVLPPVAAGSASAVLAGLGELVAIRHAPLCPDEVRALAEFWERTSAQVAAARLAVLEAINDRDDVVSTAPAGQASAVFAQHALGQRRGTARRDAQWARLLRPDPGQAGDLPAVGAAYAAGDICTPHVEVAVRTHHRLGPALREALIDAEQIEAVPDSSPHDGTGTSTSTSTSSSGSSSGGGGDSTSSSSSSGGGSSSSSGGGGTGDS